MLVRRFVGCPEKQDVWVLVLSIDFLTLYRSKEGRNALFLRSGEGGQVEAR